MTSEKSGSNYKLILAILLIVGIIGIIMYAKFGQNLIENIKSGRITAVNSPPPSEPFGITFSTGSTALYGKSFPVEKSMFTFSGVCSSVKINSVKIEREEKRCSGSSDSFTGTFQYTPFGSILFTGSSAALTVNSDKYSSSNSVALEFEIIPSEFSVGGLNEKQISIIAPSGKVEKYGKDGSLKGIAYLSQTSLDISNLNGRVELKDGELKITGTATSVKSQDFSW